MQTIGMHIFFAYIFILLPIEVCASEQGLAEPTFSAFKVFFSLVLVVLIIFVLGWYLKRMQQMSFSGARHMNIVSALALGPKERLVLVQVGDEQMLLGVAAGNVNLIKTLEHPIANETAKDEGYLFLKHFRQAMGQSKP